MNPVRLPNWHRYSLYGVIGALVFSGLAWVYVHYLVSTPGLYGRLPNRWEPVWLAIHGAAAMLTLFFLGTLLYTHIRRAWLMKRNRVSGSLVAVLMLMLVVTGYGLYYVSDEKLRADISVWHWAIGSLLALILVIHIVLGRRARRATENDNLGAQRPGTRRLEEYPSWTLYVLDSGMRGHDETSGRRTCTDALI